MQNIGNKKFESNSFKIRIVYFSFDPVYLELENLNQSMWQKSHDSFRCGFWITPLFLSFFGWVERNERQRIELWTLRPQPNDSAQQTTFGRRISGKKLCHGRQTDGGLKKIDFNNLCLRLQTMKTYHSYWALEQQAASKLAVVETNLSKLEQGLPKDKVAKSRRWVFFSIDLGTNEESRGGWNERENEKRENRREIGKKQNRFWRKGDDSDRFR